MPFTLFFLLLYLFVGGVVFAQSPVVLYTYKDFPKYGQESPVAVLRCVFNKMGREYEIRISPRKRNKEWLKVGQADGIFITVPDARLDDYAMATAPLVLERWRYYRLNDETHPFPPPEKSVGSVLGSNEELWLKERGLHVGRSVPTLDALVKQLAARRLSYILADEQMFEESARKQSFPNKLFADHFVRYVQLVAYFSHIFLNENLDFIGQFNMALKDCVRDVRKPREDEENTLLHLTLDLLLQQQNVLLETVAQDRKDGKAHWLELHQEDRLWAEAMKQGRTTPYLKKILRAKTSALLRLIAEKNEKITEIFISDAQGFLIGMNRATSDFWQGDETAFIEIFLKGKKYYISPILYDQSTQKFQVQVSLPFWENGRMIAMLTIGYDAEKALAWQEACSVPERL